MSIENIKHKTVSLDVLIEKGFEPSTEEADRTADFIDGKSALHMLDELPEKYKTIMSMRYKEILTLKEISRKTGQSTNSVAVQLHRGLIKLKLLYDHK